MAARVTQKALHLCTRTMDAVNRLMVAMDDLGSLSAERELSGLELSSAAEDLSVALETSTLRHATGEEFAAALGAVKSIRAFMAENGLDSALQKVRP